MDPSLFFSREGTLISAGFSPFYAEDRMQKYERIMTAELRMPTRNISPTAQDMLRKVLCFVEKEVVMVI
jgi:hypothetical protein